MVDLFTQEYLQEKLGETFTQEYLQKEFVGTMLRKITDRNHPAYPGLALVLAAGQDPFIVRKSNYFEDPMFARCFEPRSYGNTG